MISDKIKIQAIRYEQFIVSSSEKETAIGSDPSNSRDYFEKTKKTVSFGVDL